MAENTRSMINRYFKLDENQTSVKTEVIAGLTTFVTMAYIIFVNPEILSNAGMDKGAVFVATCLASALATLLMGTISNYPIALAPGMGVNAFFTYTVVQSLGHSWEIALGAVFLAGAVFLVISAFPIREVIFNAIPKSQKTAISVGIGFFLGIIALTNMNIIVAHPATLVTLGDMTEPTAMMSLLCFFTIVVLSYYQVPGAILIGILVITLIGSVLGLNEFVGLVSTPPSVAPVFFELDLAGALELSMVGVILAFLFVHMFDTAGTLVSVARNADLMDEKDQLPRLNKVLLSDSSSMMAGAAIGTSPVTTYIESVSGIKAGGRTGLTAVVVALLFLVSIAFSPLANSIPTFATGPALLFVACMMIKDIASLDWDDMSEYIPAIVVIIIMPMSFSISEGIAFGFISYTALKLLTGKAAQLNLTLVITTILFLLKYAFLEV